LVKASDIRRLFGKITPGDPVFFHTNSQKNIRIHSAKSDKLKTSKVICRRCNDTNTAEYDYAWTELSHRILDNRQNIKKTGRFKLQSVFPGTVRRQSTNIHLFFVKQFGCRIADENMPIDLNEFSKSLLEQKPHNCVYLTFNIRKPHNKHAGLSEVHGIERNGKCEAAAWYYSLDELDVQVSWFKTRPARDVPFAWHPERGGKIIKFRQR
jgi:hypothetical protein